MNANDRAIVNLYDVICSRKNVNIEGSYTCYLFNKGIDKILKKCGEELTEVIIAAKNGDAREIVNEVSDLIYHLLVMLAESNISIKEILHELKSRAEKQQNLKPIKTVDKNT